jgi:hypothetical protein
MDAKNMNVDQLFQANMIKQRQEKRMDGDKKDKKAKDFEGGKEENIDDLIRDLDSKIDRTPKAAAKNMEQAPKKVEKYLQISDILSHILDNTDLFLEHKLQEVSTKEEERKVLHDFLIRFLMAIQDCINFDLTVDILIDNDVIFMLMEELFEQTDQSIKESSKESSRDPRDPNASDSSNKKSGHGHSHAAIVMNREIFSRHNRLQLLIAMFNQSVFKKMYHIPYEITIRFMSDLLKAKYLPIFERQFGAFKDDTSRYEAKLALIMNCLPLMNKNLAAKFMKIIEGVLKEPATNSFLKNNTNPLRCGLMLFRVLCEVSEQHGYSENSTNLMRDILTEQIQKSLEMYTDPEEMMILVEQVDYQGKNCFWYLDEYDLYSILDCRIMDRVIMKKWSGKFDINSSILDYSTCSQLIRDKHGLLATDRVFVELNHEMFKIDWSDKTHYFKFHVWKHSMILRFQIDFFFVILLTFYFQILLN